MTGHNVLDRYRNHLGFDLENDLSRITNAYERTAKTTKLLDGLAQSSFDLKPRKPPIVVE
jgi:hypothetical protein